MKKIVITGHTSAITQNFLSLALEKNLKLKVIKVGRCEKSDLKINFFDLADCKKFVAYLASEKPDYLFLNHGLLVGKQLNGMTATEIQETLFCNMISYLMVIESLTSLDNLRTVVMSSISGKKGSYDTLYAGTKAATDLTIKAITTRLPASSRLNAISPGIISDAKMTMVRTDQDILEEKKNITPTKLFTTSTEVAKAAHYLLFETDNINGENLNLNGGLFCS